MSLSPAYRTAIEDFHRMRRRAGVREIFSLFRNRADLLSYEDVRRQLHAIERSGVELKSIPVTAIQGSVGRYTDFTRDFLPTKRVDRQRWARVKAQFLSLEGIPPIDVYQLGEVYFVADGNHRVSVARQMGNQTIDAYVKTVAAKVPLLLDDHFDQLLIKAEFAEFLDQTQFDHLYPDVDLTVTAPGQYIFILQQIEALHFARELDSGQPLPPAIGVKYWYDTIYYPIVETIREQDILKDYPERTETDLFIWIFKHRAALADSLGWEVPPKVAAKILGQQSLSTLKRFYKHGIQLFEKIIRHQTGDPGPPPGTWRQEKMASPEGRLFAIILVVIDDAKRCWEAFSQGTVIAKLEGSQLFGLQISTPGEDIPANEIEAIQNEFDMRCESHNTLGQLAFESGDVEEIIKDRACWTDLVVISNQGKHKTNIHSVVQSCPSPLLITKGGNPEFNSILLAYDGSPKSEEALFLAAYLAKFWELSLRIITPLETNHEDVTPKTIVHAKEFLDYYGLDAQFLEVKEYSANLILQAANEHPSDLIVMGGYGNQTRTRSRNRILDDVLTQSQQAIMICR